MGSGGAAEEQRRHQKPQRHLPVGVARLALQHNHQRKHSRVDGAQVPQRQQLKHSHVTFRACGVVLGQKKHQQRPVPVDALAGVWWRQHGEEKIVPFGAPARVRLGCEQDKGHDLIGVAADVWPWKQHNERHFQVQDVAGMQRRHQKLKPGVVFCGW